jgi:AcrR family transcriptional regulator
MAQTMLRGTDSIIDSATAIVLEKGIDHASLRVIAAAAGVSLGAIDHYWGGRGEVLGAVIAQAAQDHAALLDRWWTALRPLVPLDPGTAMTVARAMLTTIEPLARQVAGLASAFLVHDARSGVSTPGMVRIIAQEAAFWQRLFGDGSEDMARAAMLAAYLRDERPFALLLHDDPLYALLRDTTLARVVAGLPRVGPPGPDRFDAIVAAIAEQTRPIADHPAPTGRSAALSEHIATTIVTDGLAAVTHRRIAREAAAPPSSVAHYFPTQRDLIQAGVDALYRRMWRSITDPDAPGHNESHGRAVIRMTHDMAVAARRDPAFRLFAADMRRRRGENARPLLVRPGGYDAATAQALLMTYHGEALAAQASGAPVVPVKDWLKPHLRQAAQP